MTFTERQFIRLRRRDIILGGLSAVTTTVLSACFGATQAETTKQPAEKPTSIVPAVSGMTENLSIGVSPTVTVKPVEANVMMPIERTATAQAGANATAIREERARVVVTRTPADAVSNAELNDVRAILATTQADLDDVRKRLPARATPLPMKDVAGIKISASFPDKPNNTVDRARGVFKNTIGLGTEAFAAEPGGLLVGPDFESKATAKNPWGANQAGWGAMYDSKGHIRPLGPDTQHSFTNEPPSAYLASEGGWVLFSAPRLKFTMEGLEKEVIIDIPEQDGVNNLIYIRGPYRETQQPKQDTQHNARVLMLDYLPAATLGMRLPAGDGENTAFWSEGQVKQMVVTSHRTDSNCGQDGCSKVRIYYFDYNTRAFGVWESVADRSVNEQNVGQTIKLIHKNY